MRFSNALILTGALLVAAPALAQDNAAAPAVNAADVNVATNATNEADVNQAAAPAATAPPSQPNPADSGTTMAAKPQHRGFPWGVVGLVGLLGLLGVRKVKG